MRHLKLAILLMFMVQMDVFGQWQEKNVATTSVLTSVSFYDTENGYTVGGNKIFKTKNGGDLWAISFIANGSNYLEEILVIDSLSVIAVGKNVDLNQSVIYKTNNGGFSWNAINISNSSFLKSIYFVTPDLGYCSGGDGVILKTTDAGNTWQAQTSGTTDNLQSIFFVDELNGIAVGGSPSSSVIVRTQDGGAHWNEITAPSDNNLQSVYFVNPQTGYIVGWNGEIMKTEDGGNSWSFQSSVAMSGNLEVEFTDENTGYIVGGEANTALIQKTSNGGALWEDVSPNISQGLVSIHFPSTLIGYAVGANGTVLKTESGGVVSVMSEPLALPQISIYPNPATDHVLVQSIAPEILESIVLFDNNGQFIYQAEAKGSNAKVDLSMLEANTYFLMIQTNKGRFIQKVVKI